MLGVLVRLTKLIGIRTALPLRVMLGAIFGIALIGKVGQFQELVTTLQRSDLVPMGWESGVALGIVTLEGILAISSMFGRIAHLWFTVSAGLSALFFGYSLWRMYQDIHAPCGCFGLLFRLEPWQSLPLTACMCAVAMLGLRAVDELKADSSSDSPTTNNLVREFLHETT